jgi:hypothetical protein
MSPSVESVLVSVGAGLVVLAIALMIKRVPKSVALLLAIGICIIAFVVWPRATLVEVPDLTGLSRDEAVLRLSSLKLGAAPQPQQAPNTPAEHVVASSQDLLPGTRVRVGTVVRFGVSTPTAADPGRTGSPDSSFGGGVSIFSPTNGGEITPKRDADNVFRFDVEGTIDGVDLTKSMLLLWVQPIDPPSDQPGWYFQRLPNGIRSVSGNRWRGTCQLGNQQYPPHDGDTVDVAASVVPGDEAQRLLARQGPVTTVTLPGSVSKTVRLSVRVR